MPTTATPLFKSEKGEQSNSVKKEVNQREKRGKGERRGTVSISVSVYMCFTRDDVMHWSVSPIVTAVTISLSHMLYNFVKACETDTDGIEEIPQ